MSSQQPANLRYRKFEAGSFTSWEELFDNVAAFGTKVGPENLASISHSEDKDQAVVTVWYWER